MTEEPSRSAVTRSLRWAALLSIVFAFVLVPWLIWGDDVERWVGELLVRREPPPAVVSWVVGLLAADVFLPVPSSLVAVASGIFLGTAKGSGANFVGLTLGSLIGYVGGYLIGPAAARRVVGATEWDRAATWAQRFGALLVLWLRPVPILAEAVTFYAGAARVRLDKYLLSIVVGNGVIAVAYASVGSFSADSGDLEPALFAGFLLPGVAMLLVRLMTRSKRVV